MSEAEEIARLTAELRALRADAERMREGLDLITAMDGDQPARTNWNMLHIARAALGGSNE